MRVTHQIRGDDARPLTSCRRFTHGRAEIVRRVERVRRDSYA
jgi:hypothetical protein